MPGAFVKVDGLACLCFECDGRAWGSVVVRCDDDEEAVVAHRDERLGSEWVTLDQIKFIWKRADFGVEQAQSRTAGAKIHLRAVMIPLAFAQIDDHVGIAGAIDQITVRGEIFWGDGLDLDFNVHGRMSIKRKSAIRSTCLQASANSVARSLLMRRLNASRMLALS